MTAIEAHTQASVCQLQVKRLTFTGNRTLSALTDYITDYTVCVTCLLICNCLPCPSLMLISLMLHPAENNHTSLMGFRPSVPC